MRTHSATLALAMLFGSVSAQTSTDAPKVHYYQCSALNTYCAQQKDFGEGSECVKIEIVELPTAQERTLAGWTNLNDYIINTEKKKDGAQVGTQFSVCRSKDTLETMNVITGGDPAKAYVDDVTKAKIKFSIQPQLPQMDLTRSEEQIKKDYENYQLLNEDQKAARRQILVDNIKKLAEQKDVIDAIQKNSSEAYDKAKDLYEKAIQNIDVQETIKQTMIDDIKMLEKHEEEIKQSIEDFRKKNPEIYNLDVESFDKIQQRIQEDQKKMLEGDGKSSAATLAASSLAAAATATALYLF